MQYGRKIRRFFQRHFDLKTLHGNNVWRMDDEVRVESIFNIVGDDTLRCMYSSFSILQTLIRVGFEQYDNSRSVASFGEVGK